MRMSLCLLLLSIGSLPLAAQFERADRARKLPPDIISPDELPRDIVRLGGTHKIRVDFENDRTRVLRLSLAAGEIIPTHDDRAGVLVCINGCRILFTTPDGGSDTVDLKPGETRWMPEARRVTRNLAAGPVEILYV
jgi:hypothetical protein